MEITREVNNILVEAYEVAKKNKHELVTVEHILYAITFQERFIEVIEELKGKVDELRSNLMEYLNNYIDKDENGNIQESYNFQQVILRASEQAIYASNNNISMEHIIAAIYELDNSYAQYYLLEQGLEKRDLLYKLCHESSENVYYVNHLNNEMALDIARKELNKFNEQLLKKNVKVNFDDKCISFIASKGISQEYGAREIIRIINQEIKPMLVDEILFGSLSDGGEITLDVNDNKFIVIVEK